MAEYVLLTTTQLCSINIWRFTWITILFILMFCMELNLCCMHHQQVNNPTRKITSTPTMSTKMIISQFRDYVHRKYSWNIHLSELEFLWSKFTEFSQLNQSQMVWSKAQLTNHNTRPITTHSQFHLITIADINSFLNIHQQNHHPIKIRGILATDNSNKIISKRRNRVFDYSEMTQALQQTKEFNRESCSLQNITFCVRTFLQIAESISNSDNDIYQVLPPGIFLKRCRTRCACIQPTQECLPTAVNTKIKYALSIHRGDVKLTWILMLMDHSGCECRHRCSNRRCIAPFVLIHSKDGTSCYCKCIGGREKHCSKLLEGFTSFTKYDYECLAKGQCLMPQCRNGQLTEEDLYNHRCPR